MSDEEVVEIVCNNNGSIKISGKFVIKDPTGKEFGLAGRTVISLCRCGQSANKPFCDAPMPVPVFKMRSRHAICPRQ